MNLPVKNELRLDEGDVVTTCKIKGPDMVVSKKILERDITSQHRESFKGLECWWFDNNNSFCKAVFHAKDLKLIKSIKDNS